MNEESNSQSEWFTEEQRDKILRNVGASLIAIQAVEQLIDLGLLHVFREDPPTLAKIERANAPEYRARTLGGLLEALKEAATIDPEFDEKVLNPYLDARNEFVHRLTIGEGKSFKTNSGKLNALNKAFTLFTSSGQIMAAIGIPLRNWLDKNGDLKVWREIKAIIEQFGPNNPYEKVLSEVIKPKTESRNDIAAQIREIREKVAIFTEELRGVLQQHALLVPISENPDTLSRFNKTSGARGLLVLRYQMIRTDVLGICRIAFDQDSRVVSALKLLKDVLQSRELQEALQTQYLKPSAVPAKRIDGTPLTQDEIEMWNAAEKADVTERKETFGRLIKELADDRTWLKEHRQVFVDLRNRHIAHLEVRTDDQGTYEAVSPKGPTWIIIKETLQRLVRVAENLLTLVLDKSESFDQARELFDRDADAFWKF
jgi:hypothetical protein